MDNFVSHLECSFSGEKYNKNKIYNLSKIGKPLLVKYNLDIIKKKLIEMKLKNLIILVFGSIVFYFL